MTRTPRHPLTWLHRLAALAVVGALGACGGGGGSDAGSGTLRLALTDAPACGYDAVHVTVDRVRVHLQADADPASADWVEIALPAPRRVDLLSLTNGVLEELGQTALPAGRYRQMRLVLSPNTASDPLANAVWPTGATAEVALDTPSGLTSGLKMNVDVDVPAGQVADLLIDFDACKSVVPRGRSGRYNLKPVLRVIPRLDDAGARVVGYVDPAMAGATVSVQQDGVPVASTVPDPASGRFDLYPVPVGTYTLVLSGAGRATGVVTGVPVTADAYTFVNSASAPIDLPDGADRVLDVGLETAPPAVVDTAVVRLRQTLSDGTVVEVVARPLAPDEDPVAVPLASAAPWVAPYVAQAAAPAFAVDDATAVVGRYTAVLTATQPDPLPPLTRTLSVDIAGTVGDPLAPVLFVLP